MEKIIKIEVNEQQLAVIWAAINGSAWRGDTVELVSEVKKIIGPYIAAITPPTSPGGKA